MYDNRAQWIAAQIFVRCHLQAIISKGERSYQSLMMTLLLLKWVRFCPSRRRCSVHCAAGWVLEGLIWWSRLKSHSKMCKHTCLVTSLRMWWRPLSGCHHLSWNYPYLWCLVAVANRQLDVWYRLYMPYWSRTSWLGVFISQVFLFLSLT